MRFEHQRCGKIVGLKRRQVGQAPVPGLVHGDGPPPPQSALDPWQQRPDVVVPAHLPRPSGHDLFPSRRGGQHPGLAQRRRQCPDVVYPQLDIRIDINARKACGSAVSRGQRLMLAGDGKGKDPDGRPE